MEDKELLERVELILSSQGINDLSSNEKMMILESAKGIVSAQMVAQSMAISFANLHRKS